ncbi:MAG TPA: hypothetical protein VF633_01180 [Brevundimonas sp.]|jgi:hypothetical protein
MIRILSLAAALAILPFSAAVAEENKTQSEAAIEAAASAFEARMEAFGTRAEAIGDDKSLTEAQREAKIATLWSEYQPEVAVFTAVVSQHASKIASEALANIDVDAMITAALAQPEVQAQVQSAMAGASGMAANGAWAQNDPEQMVTYGLMAQYGVDQAMDAATGDVAAAEEDARAAKTEARAAENEARPNPASHSHH